MHIARIGERLPRLQIQFRISRSFRPRNLANLGSKICFWIRRKEHTLSSILGTKVSIGEMLRETDDSDTFRYKRGHGKREEFVDYLLFSGTVGVFRISVFASLNSLLLWN